MCNVAIKMAAFVKLAYVCVVIYFILIPYFTKQAAALRENDSVIYIPVILLDSFMHASHHI